MACFAPGCTLCTLPPPKSPPVCLHLHFHLQVETRQCFEALDEVLSVPGITCAFLGEGRTPNLLLYTWGTPHLIYWRCTCLSTNSLPHGSQQQQQQNQQVVLLSVCHRPSNTSLVEDAAAP